MAKKKQIEEPVEEPVAGEGTVKYLVTDDKGAFIIVLPEDFKLTFAAVNPANANSYGREGFCLRVYKGTKLRAVFNNVINFRDVSIPLARKVEVQTGSATWQRDDAGNFEESRQVRVDHRLEGGDDIEEIPFG